MLFNSFCSIVRLTAYLCVAINSYCVALRCQPQATTPDCGFPSVLFVRVRRPDPPPGGKPVWRRVLGAVAHVDVGVVVRVDCRAMVSRVKGGGGYDEDPDTGIFLYMIMF
jgi:hypothetical protein